MLELPVLRISFVRCLSLTSRCGAVFPEKWLEPCEDREELMKPLGATDERRFRGIRPANGFFNASLTYDPLMMRFTQVFMREGRRSTILAVMENAFGEIKHRQLKLYYNEKDEIERAKIECNPNNILRKALENVKPLMKLNVVVKGGIKYQVPVALGEYEQTFYGIRYIVEAAKEKPHKTPLHVSVAAQLIEAANNTGAAVRTKETLYRKCEANKAYAHYRF